MTHVSEIVPRVLAEVKLAARTEIDATDALLILAAGTSEVLWH